MILILILRKSFLKITDAQKIVIIKINIKIKYEIYYNLICIILILFELMIYISIIKLK